MVIATSDSVAAPVPDSVLNAAPLWRPLHYFNLYRAIIAGLFVMLTFWGGAPRPLGAYDLELFRITSATYLGFGLMSGFSVALRWPPLDTQVFLQVFVDIVALTLLMHASGGVASGFGMLLIVAVAGGSILTEGRIAILFAAMASIAVLTQQIYVWLWSPFPATNYPHAGMLGAAYFATAYLAWLSARRVRASEALAARRGIDLANLAQLNEHVVERMQSGILAVGGDRVVRLVNQSARRLLGLDRRPLGHYLGAASPPLAALLERWGEDPSRGASYLFKPAAGQIELQVSFAALGHDARDGVLVFLEDASAMRQRAQELKLASLGRLSASIAHEIRNPLSAVSHAGQLLAESGHLDSGDRRLTSIIRDNSVRMNQVVENVLDIGRGRPAEPEHLQLEPWLTVLRDELEARGSVSPENLRVEVEPTDLVVRADPSQLRQIVGNLCENGLRHAGEGAELVLRAGIDRDHELPFLEVRDNGPGIDLDHLENIFEPFFTGRADGTGLGLYIARELCEGNQASLVHVPTETGCCFRITFSDPRRRGAVRT